MVAFTGVSGPFFAARENLYEELCEEEGVLLIPGILNGILDNPSMKSDQVHPNAAGYRLMAERVAAALRAADLLGVAE